MPILRVDNYIDSYRLRAQAEDIHELAARPDKKPVTEFVNRRILEVLQPGPEDVLVDIGCGDASLLRMAGPRPAKSIGIVSTPEEQRRLESAFPGLKLMVGKAQSLPLESRSASMIVCNAVLHYLPSEKEVAEALREMARIARAGATIWLGEVSEIDEYEHYGMYRGTSMLGFLWHLLTHNGVRSCLGMVRRTLKAMLGSERIVLNSAGFFHAKPERMILLAESSGLRLKSYFRHGQLDESGEIRDSAFRYDYVFTV